MELTTTLTPASFKFGLSRIGAAALLAALVAISPPHCSAQPAATGQKVEIADKLNATLTGFKKMSDGTFKVEFTVANEGDSHVSLSTHGLSVTGLCEASLLDLVSNKRYFPLKSPEGCVGSRDYENTLANGKSIRLWLRFPKLPPEVKTVSLDLKAASFDDLSVE